VLSVCVVISVLLVWMSVTVLAQNPKAPKWPDCYSVKAVLRLPYAELEEPISAYYEVAKNRSLIDYYGWIFLSVLHKKYFTVEQMYNVVLMFYQYLLFYYVL